MDRLLARLARRLGWRAAVLVVQRSDGGVRALRLPRGLPASVRGNTDGSVAVTLGHRDDGEALLAELRARRGDGR